ncbi:DMT family transporter [Fluviispira vulneris]|uniref:DMT family transporter n=1 Tax=Fluviispira vulneris TaxID=2763012 RepID=UPI001645CEF8|nr:DMT family transporter [Fluviispira vulneris]
MPKFLAIFLVICSTFFWGANFNVGKYVVNDFAPMIATALRFLIASILIFTIVMIKDRNFLQTFKNNFKMYFILGIIGVAGFNGLFLFGVKYSSPINCALIMSTNPLVTNIFAYFILKKKIFSYQKIGMLISLVGVIIILTQGSLHALLNLNFAFGDILIIIGNICWALYGVLSIRYLSKSSPLATTASTMIIGTIALIVFSFFEGHVDQAFHQSSSIYLAITFMAICGAVLAYLFWNIGMARLGAAQTSIFFNFVPVFTVLVSIFLGHPIYLIQIVGGVIILCGVIISSNVIQLPIKVKKYQRH